MFSNRQVAVIEVIHQIYGQRESENIAKAMEGYLDELADDQLPTVLKRLQAAEPWQYIAGSAWFYGLELKVNPSVLIPRPETEELVYHILLRHGQQPPLKVLDIGTGSGCIPLALKFNRVHWEISGCDVSEAALAIAKTNAQNCGLSIDWQLSDILKDIPSGGPWDIIVSNPPYIPISEKDLMRDNVLNYEPELALFVQDNDPLLFYKRIAEIGQKSLYPGGYLYVEINEFYATATKELLVNLGYSAVEILLDLSDKPRMIVAGQPV